MRTYKNLLGAAALVAIVAVFGFAMPKQASAATLPPTISEPFSDNTPFPGTNANFGDSISLAKCDETHASPRDKVICDWKDGNSPGDYTFAFSFSNLGFNDRELVSLDWSFNPNLVENLGSNDVLYPKYVGLKAGNNYIVYAYADGVLSGRASTFDGLDGKEISYIDWYNSTTVVPVPAALPLLLTALGALGIIGRKKMKAAATA